jgi:pimeloyl-ACP methyl ester carboxylesterase
MLLVHGEADAAVPLALAEFIVAAMPNARLEVIPNGGHLNSNGGIRHGRSSRIVRD